MTKTNDSSGCRPCACRDCMEPVYSTLGAMCHECEDAGCELDAECQVEPEHVEGECLCSDADAYLCLVHEKAERIAELCRTEGAYPIAKLSDDPATVLPRLLEVLHELAPAGLTLAAIPDAALVDGAHPAWNGGAAEQALQAIVVALNAHAPEGFAVILDGESIGFYPIAGEGI